MLQYFLYNTDFGNTIVNSSGTTFSPVPPYAELYFDYSMPEIQPLYLYAVSGGSFIVVNSQENIDNYLTSVEAPPTPDDNVTYGEFTGITETLKYTSITGATNLGGGNGSLYTTISGNKINLKTLSGGTNVTLTCNGNYVTINATGGWGSITGNITGQTDLNNCLNSKQATITGGATSITSSDLLPGRALISDSSGKVTTANTTSTDIAYLFGVTDSVQTQLNNRVLSSTYNTYVNTTAPNQFASKGFVSNYTGVTAPNTYLSKTSFATYTGTTVPNTYYNKSQINSYTGTTLTNINSRLLTTTFNTWSGTTLPNNYLSLTGGTISSNLRIVGDLYLTGTTPTVQELEDSYLLGVLTADGRIIKTDSSTQSISQDVIDISSSTGITKLYGIYYVDTTAGNVTLTIPNVTAGNDGSRFSIIKNTGNYDVIITTVGGIQNIGNSTSQTISQSNKGITIVSDNGNSKWLIVQDSRFLQGFVEGELQYWDTDTGKWKVTGGNLLWRDTTNTLDIDGGLCVNTLTITGSSSFSGVVTVPKPAQNDNTTCAATTSWYISQAGTANPVMNGTVAVGTSNLFSRQDHVHPIDTSRVAKAGDTITGSLGINNNLTVTGVTKLGNVTIDVNQQNYAVIDITTKKLANSGTKFNVYGSEFQNAQDLTITTTTSRTPAYATKVSITTPTIPIGTYRITGSYGMNKAITTSDVLSRIQVDGVNLGNIQNHELSDTTTWLYTTRVMFITFATATTHTITLQFSQEAAGTLSMGDATLELIRVS